MRSFKIAALLATSLVNGPAYAQKLSLGVVGGGSLTDGFETKSTPFGAVPGEPGIVLPGNLFYSPSKDYIVGAMVELRFSPHWSVEVDGLYRKLHFTTAAVLLNGSLNSVSPSPVITWEFPILAKYRVDWWKIKPFLELGPSFRTAGNLNGTNPSHIGITTGAGVEFHVGRVNIAPALRYTRWSSDTTVGIFSKSKQDQLELLVGVGTTPQSEWRPLGQRFELGSVLGTELTDGVRNETFAFPGFASTSHPIRSFLAGPSIELRLPHASLELDAVYHPLRSETMNTVNGVGERLFTSGIATWEFPLMAKYTVPTPYIKPFVEAGPSFRLPASGISTHGVLAGVGFEAHFRSLKVAPTIRYTYWAAGSQSGSANALPNQVELLVRFSL